MNSRHVHGAAPFSRQVSCAPCETLIEAPVAPHIIDKSISTVGLRGQVLVAKYLECLPLYRQKAIFDSAGLATPRSALGT